MLSRQRNTFSDQASKDRVHLIRAPVLGAFGPANQVWAAACSTPELEVDDCPRIRERMMQVVHGRRVRGALKQTPGEPSGRFGGRSAAPQ